MGAEGGGAVRIVGPGRPTVAMIPSLGRPASDFDTLAGAVAATGHTCALVEPVEAIDGRPGPDLLDLARDVVGRLADAGAGAGLTLIGHAFGNRLSRAVVSVAPERIDGLVLLAAGGLVPIEPEVGRSLVACFDASLPLEEHRRHVGFVFFSDAGHAPVWDAGWDGALAAFQRAALERTPLSSWWSAAPDRVLVVQGLDDRIAVPENGRRYVAELVGRGVDARLVELADAGHALLPEQPAAIAAAVTAFLRGEPT